MYTQWSSRWCDIQRSLEAGSVDGLVGRHDQVYTHTAIEQQEQQHYQHYASQLQRNGAHHL